MRRVTFVLVLSLGVVAAACSSKLAPATDVSNELGEAYIGEDTDTADTAENADVADDPGEQAAAPTTVVVISEEPAVRVPENDGQIESSNWLARTYMDASSVELVWSPVPNVDNYRLYRVPTADADYDAIDTGDVSGTELVYEGVDYGFIDTDITPDTFFTYLIVADVDGTVTQPRWTEALTTTDVTPPSAIENLTAEVTADGVLLGWSPSTDDVEFASYSVSILDGDQLQYIGGGADPGQTSFLDPEPFEGTRTYYVVAVDFHDNRSESAQVDVVR